MPDIAAIQVIDEAERATAALHPLRQRILAELVEPDSAAGLSRRLGVSRQALNYHVRQLEAEGFLEVVEERPVRGCTERLLRSVAGSWVISPAALGTLAADPARVADQASSEYLVAVASRAIRELSVLRGGAAEAGKKLPTLTLAAEVRFAGPEAQHAFARELTESVTDLIAKYDDEAAPAGRRFRVMVGAYPTIKDDAVEAEGRT